jgi:hypothetical protein
MPFGLRNAAQTFQRFMDSLLKHLPFVFCYLDDIIIASHSLEEHLEHLRQIFTILQENGLQINPVKCVFAAARACLTASGARFTDMYTYSQQRYWYLTAVSPTSTWTWSGRCRPRAATPTCSPSLTKPPDGRRPSRLPPSPPPTAPGLSSPAGYHKRVPATITSDRGAQFTSALWAGMCSLLNTTAYHPQSNGLVERFHRWLKDALRSRAAAADWQDHLPWVPLGIRAAYREDSEISPAESVYGSELIYAWTVHQHRRVAVAVLPQRAADHDDRPPATAGTAQPGPSPTHAT